MIIQKPQITTAHLNENQANLLNTSALAMLNPTSPGGRRPSNQGFSLLSPPIENTDSLNFTTISSLGERDTNQV